MVKDADDYAITDTRHHRKATEEVVAATDIWVATVALGTYECECATATSSTTDAGR